MAQQELRIIVKADGTVTVTRQLDEVTKAANKASAAGKKLSLGKEFMKGMVSGALTAAAAYMSFRTAIRLATNSLEAYNTQVMAIKQLNATLVSTGREAEFTTQELGNMASALQQVSNYGDEEILSGATIGLLRFDDVAKDIFPRAQKLVIDMAAKTKDLDGNAKQLGMALSDPVLAITKLRRSNVFLNESQQELIKSFVAAGEKAKAQEIILTALESKYAGAALAGVTASVQLKNAWGDYLETIGGSISAFDGVKKGMAQFFTGVAANSDALSKTQMKHILDVQERWALATHDFMVKANAAVKIISGTVALHVGGITQIIKVAYAGWQQAINGFLTAWIDMSRYIIQYNPFSIIIKANKELLKIMGIDIKLDFIDQEQLAMLDKAQSAINKLFPKSAAASVDEAGNAILQWGKNLLAAGTDAAKAFSTGTDEITKFYDAQRKLVDSGINPFTNAEIGEGQDAGALMAQIDKNQAMAEERLGDSIGSMLSAWSSYYTALDQYSNESIEHQANLYKYQLQQQYGTILSMQQIDEMYNAKLWDLRDAQLAHFAENYEAMPEIVEESMSRMAQITQESVDDIQRSGFNLLNDSIYSLISGTKSLKDAWANAWQVMQEIALRAMSEIITKMITTYMWQTIIGMGTSSLFAGSGMVMPSPGVWTQPVPIPTLGTGTGGINSSISGGGMGSVMSELRSLRVAMATNNEPNFNLYMDGVPLRHALNRVEKRLNYLGSGA